VIPARDYTRERSWINHDHSCNQGVLLGSTPAPVTPTLFTHPSSRGYLTVPRYSFGARFPRYPSSPCPKRLDSDYLRLSKACLSILANLEQDPDQLVRTRDKGTLRSRCQVPITKQATKRRFRTVEDNTYNFALTDNQSSPTFSVVHFEFKALS
jgi:hypothetical protein